MLVLILALSLVLGLGQISFAEQAASPLPLIPWPQKVTQSAGEMSLHANSRILAADPSLEPLAHVLAGELFDITGLQLQTAPLAASGSRAAGHIVLRIDPALKGEAYRLRVGDSAMVEGGNYEAVALGTVTLLQAVQGRRRQVSVPHMTVADRPAVGYRGLMIDVARNRHSIDILEQCVELCRLYKIRYLQLHLNDGQSWTFPSTAYPKLGTKNWNGIRKYTLAELRGLVKYADERGVTIIPELEVPGHSGAMERSMPKLFGYINPKTHKAEGLGCINMTNDAIYPALNTLIGEIAEVFKSSPYIHIGCDEVWLGNIRKKPTFKPYLKSHHLENGTDLFMSFIGRMDEMVKAHGKRTILWEGFPNSGTRNHPISKDAIVMEFEVRYNMPGNLVKHGYSVINASWTPLYLTPGVRQTPEHIYAWNLFTFGRFPGGGYNHVKWFHIKPTPQVLGAQMCAWEQPGWMELPSLRSRLAPMSERIWNPDARRAWKDFEARFAHTDAMLQRLLTPVGIKTDKAVTPLSDLTARYDGKIHVAMSNDSFVPDAKIHYTLNGEAPTPRSPVYSHPITISDQTAKTVNGGNNPDIRRTVLKARLFQGDKPVGYMLMRRYDYDYIIHLPRKAHLTIYDSPGQKPKAPADLKALTVAQQNLQPWLIPNSVHDLPGTGCVLVYKADIKVPESGSYDFRLRSHNGGAQLYIDGKLLCDRSGKSNWGQTDQTMTLSAGDHPIEVRCFMPSDHMFMTVKYRHSGTKRWKNVDSLLTTIPANAEQ